MAPEGEARLRRSEPRRSPSVALLYDEDCPFCRWSVARVLRWGRDNRLRGVAIQSAEGDVLLAGLAPPARLASLHLVDSAGVHSGGAAVNALLALLPGAGPLAALSRRWPGLTDAGYRFVARHRRLLGKLVGAGRERRSPYNRVR